MESTGIKNQFETNWKPTEMYWNPISINSNQLEINLESAGARNQL